MTNEIINYLTELNKIYKTGKSTEHSFRLVLQDFLYNLSKAQIINEAKHIDCGAPDLVLLNDNMPFAYVETKDIVCDLDKFENDEQLTRYKKSLNNLVLTNYIEFRFFRNGVKIETIKIASIVKEQIKPQRENFERLNILLGNFVSYKGESIKTAKELADIMANKAVLMRDILEKILLKEEHSSLKEQMNAFKTFLSNDLDEKTFADMYAQTITYGLFVARLNDKTKENFSRQEARDLVSQSNPFLRGLFDYISGASLEGRIVWLVDDLVQSFKNTDVNGIMATFGNSVGLTDPFLHFYETFLTSYDKVTRHNRGVYYTPESVVKFIVRAVDDILQKEFNLPKGLADDSTIMCKDKEIGAKKTYKVQVLDPATGTGTFLAETIKLIFSKFQNQLGMWQSYAKNNLIPRLNGFEILMTPYVMCHLKLEMILKDTLAKSGKQDFNDICRFRVFLTNSLEDNEINVLPLFDGLTEEIRSAQKVKKETPIMVIMGNPPYSGISMNGNLFGEQINEYKFVNKVPINEKKNWLNDDYVKFIRYAQMFIDKNKEGVLAYITNNGFLDNPTFRGMRYSLLKSFDKIYILNLHGNSMKKENCPDGSKDENVFNIKTGVSINIFVKTTQKNDIGKVYYADLFGLRKDKFDFLKNKKLTDISWKELSLDKEFYFFVPKDFSLKEEYEKGFSIIDLMPINSTGIVTMGDSFIITDDKRQIQENIQDYLNNDYNEESFKNKYQLGKNYAKWVLENKKGVVLNEKQFLQVEYRPFDKKYTYFDSSFIWRQRSKVMKHFINKDNLCIITTRFQFKKQQDWSCCFLSNQIVDINLLQIPGTAQVFPLYTYNDDDMEVRTPNLNIEIIKQIGQKTGLTFTNEKQNNNLTFAPIDVLDYIYGILHSNKYRKKYNEFLKIDFPRVSYPHNAEYFRKIALLGAEIRKLHLLEGDIFNNLITSFNISGSNEIKNIYFEDNKVYINDTQYFDNVSKLAWDFFIGGHQPAQKWLKDRKGKVLSYEDLIHYQKIILALTKTDELMQEIDKIILIK